MEISPKCSSSLGNNLGYIGLDMEMGSNPTRYYNRQDCASLGGTFTIANLNQQGFNNTYNLGTCSSSTTNFSSECALLPSNLAFSRQTGKLTPANGTVFGTPKCLPGSQFQFTSLSSTKVVCTPSEVTENPTW